MSYWAEVTKIIEGAVSLNVDKVSAYARLLAQKLEADGNTHVARRILALLAQAHSGSHVRGTSFGREQVPFDQDSRLPIADVYPPEAINVQVVLNRDIAQRLSRFLAYYRHSAKLIEAGLELPYTLLLYGPPGCGKTVLAKYIAKELNLPLVVARLDTLISSYLGNTSKNIRLLFEHAKERPCVLFLDEFDAIAKLRDDQHELGELKRVVNSLLQNIDTFGPESVLIAATNHEQLLDPAVWRRFTYTWKLELPDREAREALVRLFLRGSMTEPYELRVLAELFRGLSGADIEVICTQALRDALVNGSQRPRLQDVTNAFFEHLRLKGGAGLSNNERVLFLRQLDPGFFSFRVIGDLLGCSRQWAQKLYTRRVSHGARGRTVATDQDSVAPGR